MKNARELAEDRTMKSNFSMPLHLVQEIIKETNIGLSEFDVSAVDTAFALGIEEILKEMAVLKMIELAGKRATIENNSTDNEAWSVLQNLNDELYDKIEYNQAEIADKNVVLGFVEGYLTMKRIAENDG